jgi:hypothetical protein
MQDCSNYVIAGDPANVLLAVSDPTAQPDSRHRKLASYQRIVAIDNHTESRVHDPDPGVRCRFASGFPLLCNIGQESVSWL